MQAGFWSPMVLSTGDSLQFCHHLSFKNIQGASEEVVIMHRSTRHHIPYFTSVAQREIPRSIFASQLSEIGLISAHPLNLSPPQKKKIPQCGEHHLSSQHPASTSTMFCSRAYWGMTQLRSALEDKHFQH